MLEVCESHCGWWCWSAIADQVVRTWSVIVRPVAKGLFVVFVIFIVVVAIAIDRVVIGAWQGLQGGFVRDMGLAAVGHVIDKHSVTRNRMYLGSIRSGAAVDRKGTQTDLSCGNVQRRSWRRLDSRTQHFHGRGIASNAIIWIVCSAQRLCRLTQRLLLVLLSGLMLCCRHSFERSQE
jgi:hypothetical protein